MKPSQTSALLALLVSLAGVAPTGCSGASSANDAAAAVAEASLAERRFVDGKVRVQVPADFVPLEEPKSDAKFTPDHAPIVALQSPDHAIVLLICLRKIDSLRPPRDFGQATADLVRWFDDSINRPRSSTTWFRNESVVRDGHAWLMCDLVAQRDYEDQRAIVATTTFDKQSLEIAFVCPQKLGPAWGSMGKKIVESVIVRG